jgi:hypothetical protein
MGRNSERAKARKAPSANEKPRIAADPSSYLHQTPVWRFSDFDWDGDWGYSSCAAKSDSIRLHIEQHLASFETMTWGEILKASGGRRNGNNNHEIQRDKFKPAVQDRLRARGVLADTLFSLRLDAGTRVYGVREGRCLLIVFFDPHHKDRDQCAYDFQD